MPICYFRKLVDMGRIEFFGSEWVRIIKSLSGHVKTSAISLVTYQKMGGLVPICYFRKLVDMGRMEFFGSEWVRIMKT